MTKYFCTLFDSGYLIKGITMIESLMRQSPDSHVFVLCLDQQTKDIVNRLDIQGVTCISLDEVETEQLLQAKKTRGVAEYCWTLSPCFPWYLFQNYPEIGLLTYLDSDLLFYSPIQPIFDEIGDSSVAIIEHRFAPRLRDREVNGRFCVEWVTFRRDAEGLACLSRWRDQCIEWCYYRLEDGKMGDQKYLDEWPNRYKNCHIIEHPGAGVAPWNYEKHTFSVDVTGANIVDASPLIFYHFHQFQLLENGGFDRLSTFYTSVCPEPDEVYLAYESALTRTLERVRKIVPGFSGGLRSSRRVARRRWAQRYLPFALKELIRRFLRY
uniref:glycosyltransferase n=2 Tax=Rhizobium leguminosarum TaxID=384 RepID=UPI001C9863C8|nr:glycosyltransferase [Rhizobium leguminosarum]MBY5559247.1 hypothetical protein [Rhizobium leguminosarum]MBY5708380.1 hypothetical protein [Rhizobium leguminosarum]MBY5757851.1 hypothetical protein [Rhizobium leguminosarum]